MRRSCPLHDFQVAPMRCSLARRTRKDLGHVLFSHTLSSRERRRVDKLQLALANCHCSKVPRRAPVRIQRSCCKGKASAHGIEREPEGSWPSTLREPQHRGSNRNHEEPVEQCAPEVLCQTGGIGEDLVHLVRPNVQGTGDLRNAVAKPPDAARRPAGLTWWRATRGCSPAPILRP